MKRLDIEITGASYSNELTLHLVGIDDVGFRISRSELDAFLARRAPAPSEVWSTGRRETDAFEFLSGIDPDGRINGAPIRAVIPNENAGRAAPCDRAVRPRPGHADYAAVMKYGSGVDLRGGGRFSGRLTAPMCIVGGIVLQILRQRGVRIFSHIYSIAGVSDIPFDPCRPPSVGSFSHGERFPVIDPEAGERMRLAVASAANDGDSVGGIAEVMIDGLAAGVGGELFEGLDGRIAERVFSVPAIKGIEFGAGFKAESLRGSENNDAYSVSDGKVVTLTNNCGGILGGISDGMPIVFRAVIKPTPSIGVQQETVRLDTLERVPIRIVGNNDSCIVPRALPVIESAAAIAVYEAMEERN